MPVIYFVQALLKQMDFAVVNYFSMFRGFEENLNKLELLWKAFLKARDVISLSSGSFIGRLLYFNKKYFINHGMA